MPLLALVTLAAAVGTPSAPNRIDLRTLNVVRR